jgi:hypothetical protein
LFAPQAIQDEIVNRISAAIRTGMERVLLCMAAEEAVKNFGKQVPMKRAGQPAELATAYVAESPSSGRRGFGSKTGCIV